MKDKEVSRSSRSTLLVIPQMVDLEEDMTTIMGVDNLSSVLVKFSPAYTSLDKRIIMARNSF